LPKPTRGRRPASTRKRPHRTFAPAGAPAGVAAPTLERDEVSDAVAAAPVARQPLRSQPATQSSFRRTAPIRSRPRFAESIADYAYVPGDLRQIAIFSAGLVVFLVVLSFFVQ
jgi:hypothetical protein